jgi:hypothetical protein
MRELTIKVSMEDNHPLGCHIQALEKSPNGEYNIVISKKQIEDQKVNLAQVISHEIGHALGFEFDLPFHRKFKQLADAPAHIRIVGLASGAVVKMEQEAWDFAKQFFELERISMDSYKESQKTASLMNWFNAGKVK